MIFNSDCMNVKGDFLDETNLINYDWKQKFLYYYLKPFSFFKNLYGSIISFKCKL